MESKRTIDIVVERENRENEERKRRKEMNETTMSTLAEESLNIGTLDPGDQQDDEGNEIEQTEGTADQQRSVTRAIVAFERSTEKDEAIHRQRHPNN